MPDPASVRLSLSRGKIPVRLPQRLDLFVIWIKGAVSQVFDTLKKAPACGGRGFLRENWESELFVKIRGLCVQKYLYPASALFKHRPVLFSQSIYQRHFIPGHRPQPNSSQSSAELSRPLLSSYSSPLNGLLLSLVFQQSKRPKGQDAQDCQKA